MSFNIYTKAGLHYVQFFETIEELIAHMIKNNQDAYHRIDK
jgi:hypothetical protein